MKWLALGMFATSSWLAETWFTSLEASVVPVFEDFHHQYVTLRCNDLTGPETLMNNKD